jgi:hypothetical protein
MCTCLNGGHLLTLFLSVCSGADGASKVFTFQLSSEGLWTEKSVILGPASSQFGITLSFSNGGWLVVG